MFTHQIRSFRSAEELMRENMLVKHYAGSLAYGTNLPTSDVDFRGIFCADPVNVRTPFFKVKECEDKNEEDTKLYELTHFFQKCLDCNPNIVETLWVEESDIIQTTDAYKYLRENREELLSSKIAFTTSGYAHAQLKRIKGHNKWINNPQDEEPPRQIDFVSLVQWYGPEKMFKINLEEFLDGYRLVPYGGNIFGIVRWDGYSTYDWRDFTLNTVFEGETHETGMPIGIIKYNKEEYNIAKDKWKQYWEWKENRNEARSELEEKYGYDTKHAMHLVRLLRMGIEALRGDGIIVKRPDAEELLAIRDGAWTYEEVLAYAADMDLKSKEMYKNTVLRKKPNLKTAAKILMNAQDMVWNEVKD